MPTPYLGEVKLVPLSYAPKGWAFCNGQILSINQNQALFSLLGTFYGGDGVNNFALPNLQGRSVVGTGNGAGLSGYMIGQQFGASSLALGIDAIPSHTHTLNVSSALGTQASPVDAHLAVAATAVGTPYDTATTGAMPGAILSNAGGQGHENRQPFLTLNYIIAIVGIYPPRS